MNFLKILLTVYWLFSVSILGTAQTSQIIKLNRNNKTIKYQAVINENFGSLSTFDNVGRTSDEKITFGESFLRNILKKVKVFSIFGLSTTQVKKLKQQKNAGIYAGNNNASSDTSFFSAVTYKNGIYIFKPDDYKGNIEVFNILTKDLNILIEKNGDARQITEFFIFLNTYRFKAPSQLILSSIEDIPLRYRNENIILNNQLKPLIEPLKVENSHSIYQIKFFTWRYLPNGNVLRWEFNVSKSGYLEAESKNLGKF